MRHALVMILSLSLLAGCGGSDEKPDAEKKPSRLKQFTFKQEAKSNRPVDVALPGEDAELTAPDGRTVKVSDYRGKPVLLVFTRGFMGSICPFCTTYTAQLASRRDELTAMGVTTLLVYPTKETDEGKVKEFTDEVNLILKEEGQEAVPFPVFLDRGLAAVQRFNLSGDLSRPSTFVLDGKGVVRYCYVGEAPDDRPAADRVMQELKKVQKGS